MTVSSRDAETMSYLVYKVTVWSRLMQFWLDHRSIHPEDADLCKPRLAACRKQLNHWKKVANGSVSSVKIKVPLVMTSDAIRKRQRRAEQKEMRSNAEP